MNTQEYSQRDEKHPKTPGDFQTCHEHMHTPVDCSNQCKQLFPLGFLSQIHVISAAV